MFSNTVFYLLLVIAIFGDTEGKIFKPCELATTLMNNGIPKNQLGDWVCIAKHESNFNTQATNQNTGDYGIFQISHLYWCADGNSPGKGCQVTCRQLLDDNISDDISCIKKIYRGSGFKAWVAYNQHCSGRNNAQYVKDCKL